MGLDAGEEKQKIEGAEGTGSHLGKCRQVGFERRAACLWCLWPQHHPAFSGGQGAGGGGIYADAP